MKLERKYRDRVRKRFHFWVKMREDVEGLVIKDKNGGRNTAGAESLNVVIK